MFEIETKELKISEELKYNRGQINILTENNNSLELRVKTLGDKIKKR